MGCQRKRDEADHRKIHRLPAVRAQRFSPTPSGSTAGTSSSSPISSRRPGEKTLPLNEIDHRVVREYASWMYDQHLEKASVARRLASLRTFFKFCMREKLLRENPARFCYPGRSCQSAYRVFLTAEELNGFLDSLGQGIGGRQSRLGKRRLGRSPEEAKEALKRDRAILELLYGSGLRVSELAGLDVPNLDRQEQMLRVLGKGRKQRQVPFGRKAQEALEAYWPVREAILGTRAKGRVRQSSRPYS